MRRLTFAAFFVVVAAVPLVAEPPVNVTPGPLPTDQAVYGQTTPEEFQRMQALQALQNAHPRFLTRNETADAARSRNREQDCLRATGDKKFCKCFREKSPAVGTYADYATVVTQSKEQLRYQQLDKDTKAYVDQLLAVRTVCVPQSQATR